MNQLTEKNLRPAGLASQSHIEIQGNGFARPLESATEEISLVELWYNIADYKWLVAGIVSLAAVLGVFGAMVTPNVYKVDAMLQVETKKSGGLAGLEDLTNVLGQGGSSTLGELEILKSRTVVDAAADKLNLRIRVKPNYFPVIGQWLATRNQEAEAPVAPLLGLSGYVWGGEKLSVVKFAVPEEFSDTVFTLQRLPENTYAVLDANGETLALATVGKSAEFLLKNKKAELLVEEFRANAGTLFFIGRKHPLSLYNSLATNLVASEAGKNTNILRVSYEDEDAAFATQFLNEVVNAYVNLNVNRRGLEAQQQLAFLDQQLPDIKLQLKTSEEKLNEYLKTQGTVDPSAETANLLTKNVALETRRVELQLQRKQLLQKYEPKHPVVAAVDDQLSRLTMEAGDVAGLTRRLPDTQQEYLRLKRDVAVSQELYTSLLNGAQQLKVAKAGAVGNVAVVDYAVKPKLPVRPKKGQIVGLAVLAGVFLGVLAAQVIAFMRSAVRDPSTLEAATGLSVFSIVPLSRAQEDAERSLKRRSDAVGLLAVKVPGDASIEALRSFRTGLQFATIDAPNSRVLITGPVPEIGKSFVSANFAAIMAQAGKRVILVDGDMRKGTLARYFAGQQVDAKRPLGLSDVISAEISFEKALIKTELANLDVLLSGTVPPNPSELLLHPHFLELLEKLDALYDYIIIDSPPVLLVSDASVIAQHCAATFVVARYGATSIRQVSDTQKRLSQAGVNVNGLIFNGFMANRGAHYYGYKYGYGKYKDSYGSYGTYGKMPEKRKAA